MKKKLVIGGAVILAVTAVIVGSVLYNDSRFDLKINGDEISEEEYLYVMNHQIYYVTQELTKENNKQINTEFWSEEIDGRLPYEVLADTTIEQLKYYRAVYENAREQGYVNEIDYEHIVKRMETENQNRAAKIEKGEPVYGLSKFTAELFMEYEMDTFQKQYCNDYENDGMDISDEERLIYYDEYKDSLFVKDDDMTLDYIKISYESDEMSEAQTKELKNELISLYKDIEGNITLKSLAEKSENLKEYLFHEEILSGEWGAKSRVLGDVLEYAYELEKGETTQVIDEYGVLYLIQCTDKTDYDYLSIEEVKDNINKELRERSYNRLIQERADKAAADGDMKQVYDFTKKHIKK